ncbi:MAG: hypothetical protein DI585_01670 [Pseudomonas fluorescens]|nr:MAG: hypothetical protein DI585_01670 [Pseudomonas fluorescens]
MSDDIFEQTIATYRRVEGAEGFVAKELRHQGGSRDVTSYSMLEGVVLDGKRVLDIGCGFGRDVAELRRRGAEAYGCDVSPALLAMAQRDVGPYFVECNVRQGDVLPFGGGFDLIWCCALLVHIPRPELRDVMKRMWNGLREGGSAIVISKQGEGQSVARNLGEDLPRVMVMYRPEELVDVWTAWGGEIEVFKPDLSVTPYGDSLFGVRLRKRETA